MVRVGEGRKGGGDRSRERSSIAFSFSLVESILILATVPICRVSTFVSVKGGGERRKDEGEMQKTTSRPDKKSSNQGELVHVITWESKYWDIRVSV